MKRIAILITVAVVGNTVFGQTKDSTKRDSFLLLEPVEVKAIRAAENAPFTKTNLTKKQIEKLNVGQDLPFILNQTPSVVVNSDAGNGVGYTGIRIRGSDASRINVTLNGVPFNDAESQGTFFVDLPDFSSSVGSIQVQRGVGTSSNGAGAFGASINISTNEVNLKPYAEFNNGYGSFNTWKNTIKVGSGLVSDHFTTDFRLSRIRSDGYIDRASSDLRSFYFSTAYLGKKNSLRFNMFSGKEKTYQAWYGVSEADLQTNRTINYAGMERPGEPYNNETDNYKQDHYQLFYNQELTSRLKFNLGLFYIKGKGYYEQYKADQAYVDYGLPEPIYGTDTITNTDLVRQLWLDNDFYGNIFSLQYKANNSQLTVGGGWNRYEGNHYGDVIWAEKGLALPGRWYDLDANKNDFTIYFKQQTKISSLVSVFYDLQYRAVKYDLFGFRDNPDLIIKNDYNFFNPKVGLSFQKNEWSGYLSYSRGQKEPNREDFEAGTEQQPKPEKLNDLESGIEKRNDTYTIGLTGYYMRYEDQLVLTGKINDVGAYTRTNIPKSYRAGLELVASAKITSWLNAAGNFSVSKNKVKDFTEYIDDYDNGGQQINQYSSTDIAFSPNMVGGATINFIPLKNAELSFISKYVGKQYLDNTQNESRKLNAFYTQDARFIYTISKGCLKELNIIFQANNLFEKLYEPNGYTFSYYYGGSLTTENYYFPMAGRNFMVGVNLKF
ncbi:MAG TPA: TonB-dependent receptor plug domain-containing protein [Chitinophagaceae bacterium]|jgi:iron complex outermembrane receptor protein|nr:TonB-dependent receptor plug domain-containing protein [Chitinophagaceae bacterium]